jgi:hypothetical protein
MVRTPHHPASVAECHHTIDRLTALLRDAATQLLRWAAEKKADTEALAALESENRDLRSLLEERDRTAAGARAVLAALEQRAGAAEERALRAEERFALVRGAERWRHLFDAELARRAKVRRAA